MSDMTHEEKAAGYARIAEQARQDKLIAFCRAYEGDSTAHNLIKRLAEEQDKANAALRTIAGWADAYPLEAFAPVDMEAARAALEAAGLSIGALHAQWARHLTAGIGAIAREALEP